MHADGAVLVIQRCLSASWGGIRHRMLHERTTSDRAAKLGYRGRYAVMGC